VRCATATVNVARRLYCQAASERIFRPMNTTNDETTTTWTIDPVHTTVGFSIRHLMVANVRGEFQSVSGTVRYDADRPEATTIEVTIPTTSIHTRDAQRDAHLQSPELFDAEQHPTITFRSTRARATGVGALEVTGDLTLRGTTHEVTLAVVDISGEQKDLQGNTRIGAGATTKIRRSDFGMTFNKVLEAGGVALGDEVSLTLDASLVKDKAPSPA
jgi:polyisoprenoid-binding protein YceI